MGSLSACPHRVCIPWKGLLLAVSLLTFWNLPTSAQTTVEVVPFNVAEGKEVLLLVHNASQDLYGYNWYKGERVHANYRIIGYVIKDEEHTPGPAHNGRETIYPNGSLLIQNVTHSDAGIYTLHVINKDLVNEEVTSQFYVFSVPPKPSITSNNFSPVENKDIVALTCQPETQNTTYLWWVNNQSPLVSPRLLLSTDNRTVVLLSVTKNDMGSYECEIQNTVGASRSDPVTLNVRSESVQASSPDLSAGTAVSIIIGVLAGMALI
ncbi:carcinoembryonic antigen-related cell adhesion molecule 7 [Hylobates moloch]|uniref:carcinoembryonic antigen-related cell adhesion molecule 7 n=1 Tax=Hylobates moloch TaxID=81572 RepID=UPI001363FCFF|nr:carcinoembryonic antigen-related cell adhesion molecule 7 [Hylobates moloch]XP_032028684.1 carcinoembryonic antigen-related cell adhesion molecule 7 [Hylobates moloch]